MPKPKKTVAKKSSKKVAKLVSKTTKTAASNKATHPLHQHYFHQEQADFHRAHPRANSLIATFIVAFSILTIMYVSKMY